MKNSSNILLIYTGGTIGMVKDFETGALKAFNFDELLQNIPELKLLEHTIETVSFSKPIDSSNMRPAFCKTFQHGSNGFANDLISSSHEANVQRQFSLIKLGQRPKQA